MYGVTEKDRIRNEHVGGSVKVSSAAKKIIEGRLKRYGYLRRSQTKKDIRRNDTRNETERKTENQVERLV